MAEPQDDSYDLFARKAGRKAETVLVVTPYVEQGFFKRLIADLKPKRLHVVIDDGCRREDIQMIKDCVAASKRKVVLTCVPGSAPGLVHLKLFYIVWSTEAKRTARTLVFGSANATRQGFGGRVNAELIASCRLTKTRHSHIIDWCEGVLTATSSGEECLIGPARDLDLGTGLQLRLPGMRVGRERSTLSNFDLWIQRGYLLSEYRPEPSFLKVIVHLKQSLAQSDESQMVTQSGFDVPVNKTLTYHYAGNTGPPEDGQGPAEDAQGEAGNWRRRLFVWTHLGDWCSEACHCANDGKFKRRGYDNRVALIQALEGLGDAVVLAKARQAFLDAVSGLWDRLGSAAGSFLEGDANLDRAHYARVFDERVARDLELLEDPEFKSRYLSGYELAQVPRFRTDIGGWGEFLESMTRQLCLDHARGGRSHSLFLKAVREAIQAAGEDSSVLEEGVPLLGFLRTSWRDSKKRPGTLSKSARILEAYHAR